MRKFLPGGRCGGGGSSVERESNPQTNAAFDALLVAREAQTNAIWKQPPLTQPQTNTQKNTQQALVVIQKKPPASKEDLINRVLEGDF